MLRAGGASVSLVVISNLVLTMPAWGAPAGAAGSASPPNRAETPPTEKATEPLGTALPPSGGRSEVPEQPAAKPAVSEQATSNQARPDEPVVPTPQDDRSPRPAFFGHVGLALGVAGASELGTKLAYGLHAGIGWRIVEIGFLVGSWGLFTEENQNDLAAYPFLFQLNGVLPVTSDLRLFLGPQLGFVRHRENIIGLPPPRYFSGYGSANAFAYGVQGGLAFRLLEWLSLRLELEYVHVDQNEVQADESDGRFVVATYYRTILARNFLHAFVAICLGF